jgi:Helix-hairpin-helix motif
MWEALMSRAKFILLVGLMAGGGAVVISGLGRKPASHGMVPRHRQRGFMDLNSAPAEDLKRLGLNDVAVDRILENRPYRNKLELVSRMVIPERTYGKIRHQVGIRRTSKSAKIA